MTITHLLLDSICTLFMLYNVTLMLIITVTMTFYLLIYPPDDIKEVIKKRNSLKVN